MSRSTKMNPVICANYVHSLDAQINNNKLAEAYKIMGITYKDDGLIYPSNEIKMDVMILSYGGQPKTEEGKKALKILLSK